METTTAFDLNQAIQHWREDLGQSSTFRRENLNELESHLRDSVAALEARGLSADEAFTVAAKRMGKDASLEMEFAKINRDVVWLNRVLWMLIGIQAWPLVSGMVGLFPQNAVFYGLKGLNFDFVANGVALPVVLLCASQLLTFSASLALCWWLIRRGSGGLDAWANKLLRSNGKLAMTFGLFFLFSLLTTLASFGLELLRARNTPMSVFGHYALSRQYSMFIWLVIQPATMMALTLFLARKRFRISQT